MQISIIGLDIAKQVFQVHAVDAEGHAVAQVRLRRAQVMARPVEPGIDKALCRTALHRSKPRLRSSWAI